MFIKYFILQVFYLKLLGEEAIETSNVLVFSAMNQTACMLGFLVAVLTIATIKSCNYVGI